MSEWSHLSEPKPLGDFLNDDPVPGPDLGGIMTAIGRDKFRKAIAEAARELTSGSDVPDANHDLLDILLVVRSAGIEKDPGRRLAAIEWIHHITSRTYRDEKARMDEAAELAAELAVAGAA